MANAATLIKWPAADPAAHRKVNVGELVLGPTEREYLQQVIDSGRLSYGPFTRRFEAEFARRHRVARACFCGSGTAVLQFPLAALKEQRNWQPGDEVIVPSVTFVAAVNVVLMVGLTPVLVDDRPDTYTIDAEQIAAAIIRVRAASCPFTCCVCRRIWDRSWNWPGDAA